MSFKELSIKYNQEFDKVCNIIRENIDYGNRIEIYPSLTGISVNFMFRGECDYTLAIPLEYCEDGEKIKDYYQRFKAFVKDESSLASYDTKAGQFYNMEMEKL